MKTRQGFVSNSSASNFLVFGFEVPYKSSMDDDVREFNKQMGMDLHCLYDDGKVIVGKVIYDTHGGEYMERIEVACEELMKIRDTAKANQHLALQILGGFPEFKLIAGTRAS